MNWPTGQYEIRALNLQQLLSILRTFGGKKNERREGLIWICMFIINIIMFKIELVQYISHVLLTPSILFHTLNCLTKKTQRQRDNLNRTQTRHEAWNKIMLRSQVGVEVNVIVCDKSQWKYFFGDKQKKSRYVTKAWYSKRKKKKKRMWCRMISQNFKIIHSLWCNDCKLVFQGN